MSALPLIVFFYNLKLKILEIYRFAEGIRTETNLGGSLKISYVHIQLDLQIKDYPIISMRQGIQSRLP